MVHFEFEAVYCLHYNLYYSKLFYNLHPLFKLVSSRVKIECDGTRAETRFGLPAKRTSPFISAGVSVQSAAGSRGVRISGSNAG